MAERTIRAVGSPLVLTRKDAEGIHVNGPCLIRVERVNGKTKVAIWADKETRVLREELLPDIDGSGRTA